MIVPTVFAHHFPPSLPVGTPSDSSHLAIARRDSPSITLAKMRGTYRVPISVGTILWSYFSPQDAYPNGGRLVSLPASRRELSSRTVASIMSLRSSYARSPSIAHCIPSRPSGHL